MLFGVPAVGQVHDDGDAELSQLIVAGREGLRAAIELLADASGVGQARKREPLGRVQARHGARSGRRVGLGVRRGHNAARQGGEKHGGAQKGEGRAHTGVVIIPRRSRRRAKRSARKKRDHYR